MTGWQDDDKTRSQGSFVDHAVYWKLVPYLIIAAATVYAFIFAPPEAAAVAWFFIIAIVMHFLIRMVLATKAQDAARATLYQNVSTPAKRVQPVIPYTPDTVEAFMRDGRQYWVKHYQQENMADNIEFAEAHRRLHLRGLCDRNSCYFCHFHDMHAPYV